MRQSYPSDISREQFELIAGDLKAARKATRPRTADLYEIFCAVLYVLKNGCAWRALPHDFPNWNLVYYYYTVWSEKDGNGFSTIDYCLAKLVDITRYFAGRNPLPSMGIVDSKSVQNADTAREKGYDAGKKLRE
jgi:transposase